MIGSYSKPEDRAGRAQTAILAAVSRLAPEVVESLKALVPTYEQAIAARTLVRARQLPVYAEHFPAMAALSDDLANWAQSHHLEADWEGHTQAEWVLDHAINSLSWWAENPAWMRFGWFPTFGKGSPLSADEQAFVFEHGGADLSVELRTDARARLHGDFDAFLDTYFDVQAKTLEERNVSPSPRTPSLGEHVDWFVRYQVAEWSAARIGQQYDRNPDTVDEAIDKMAALVGIRRRPGVKRQKSAICEQV